MLKIYNYVCVRVGACVCIYQMYVLFNKLCFLLCEQTN